MFWVGDVNARVDVTRSTCRDAGVRVAEVAAEAEATGDVDGLD
jgi:hypothetical protein